MSKRQNSRPSTEPGLDKLITAAIDAELGNPDWRTRVLQGRTEEECYVDIPQRTVWRVGVAKFDNFFITDEARRLGLSPSRFIRMCIGEWMLRHTDYPRDRFEMLTRDVPYDLD